MVASMGIYILVNESTGITHQISVNKKLFLMLLVIYQNLWHDDYLGTLEF